MCSVTIILNTSDCLYVPSCLDSESAKTFFRLSSLPAVFFPHKIENSCRSKFFLRRKKETCLLDLNTFIICWVSSGKKSFKSHYLSLWYEFNANRTYIYSSGGRRCNDSPINNLNMRFIFIDLFLMQVARFFNCTSVRLHHALFLIQSLFTLVNSVGESDNATSEILPRIKGLLNDTIQECL